ncbi:uncharacterized protein P884DRAFT_251146 [Thermothelomyces heterothallicus CBS 202.75]|uniref:uncharacterized protein n=1 Tax=Thermothelomyces heterothallicus CBS 202.75 TaxID=1149848 RepID=UPI003741E979
MGSSRPPFMYQPVNRDDERFPPTKFDPKAVTRASYESKKPKPKPNGPLVSFNRHPDAHMVPSGRSQFHPVSRRTTGWIKAMRVVQVCLRVVQITAAIGLIAAVVVVGLMGWIMAVTLGLVILHAGYSVFHHFQPAGARTPGSSAAYQAFSSISDLCLLPLYAYGAVMTRSKNEEWKTAAPEDRPADPDVTRYMMPSIFYGLIGAGGLHLLSLAISLWLALMFWRIAKMPPDMNPLEANLTSRAHKRNKSSVATTSTDSTYSDEKPGTMLYDDDSSRPPPIPFMHTRQGSDASSASHDSRLNLPSRQYQIPASNRSSATTSRDFKRMSAPPSSHRASYTEIPLGETGSSSSTSRPTSAHASRPSTGSVPPYRAEHVSPAQMAQMAQTAQTRPARFTETWYASESLINRTQQRNRAVYASLDVSDDSSSDSENEANYTASPRPTTKTTTTTMTTTDENRHPNPLRSNPIITISTAPASKPASKKEGAATPRRPRTPFSRLRASVLSTISLNDRRVSGSQDITDQQQQQEEERRRRREWEPHNRDSSIQPDADFFYAKPYGELIAATPPIFVGGAGGGGKEKDARCNRVVSSGNDYDLGSGGAIGRRNVSGKVAEEGMAGARWSRYAALN